MKCCDFLLTEHAEFSRKAQWEGQSEYIPKGCSLGVLPDHRLCGGSHLVHSCLKCYGCWKRRWCHRTGHWPCFTFLLDKEWQTWSCAPLERQKWGRKISQPKDDKGNQSDITEENSSKLLFLSRNIFLENFSVKCCLCTMLKTSVKKHLVMFLSMDITRHKRRN